MTFWAVRFFPNGFQLKSKDFKPDVSAVSKVSNRVEGRVEIGFKKIEFEYSDLRGILWSS